MGLEKLEYLLKVKGISNKELAKRSGISVHTINKIVSGITKDPQYKKVVAIANALDLTIDEFILLLDLKINENNDPDQILMRYCQLDDYNRRLIQNVLDFAIKEIEETNNEPYLLAAHGTHQNMSEEDNEKLNEDLEIITNYKKKH